MIQELDIVTLTRDIQEHKLFKGSRGAVVHCYKDGQGFEVEFTNSVRETSDVLTLERADIQLERTTMEKEVIELIIPNPV